jgi:hypothetical protein
MIMQVPVSSTMKCAKNLHWGHYARYSSNAAMQKKGLLEPVKIDYVLQAREIKKGI